MADPNFLLRAARALVASSASDEAQLRRMAEVAEGDWLSLQEASTMTSGEEGTDNAEATNLLRRAAAMLIEGS